MGYMLLNIIKAIGSLFKGIGVNEINAGKLLEKVNQSETLIIIDVRNRADFKHGHIPGAICLPPAEVESGYKQLDPTKAVIVY
jgi:rhodanese-related sulfurtransferase